MVFAVKSFRARLWRVVLTVAVCLAMMRSASAADVDTAPLLLTFGARSPNPIGNFTPMIQNAVHDATGHVYVLESSRVQKFDRDGTYILSWACFSCSGIDVNQATGDVYVTLYDLHSIRRYTANGVFFSGWGGFGSAPGLVRYPHGIAVDPVTGEVYVFDTGNGRVQVFSATGTYLRQFGQTGTGPGDFSGLPSPGGVAFDAVNRVVYVTDPRIYQVKKFAEDGTFLLKWGNTASLSFGQLRWARSVEVDGQGRVFVTNTDAERVDYFTPNGVFLGTFQGPHNLTDGPFHPRDIAINRLTGEKYVNASYAFREDKFDANNVFVRSWGGRILDGYNLEAPHGIAVSPTTGDLYLVDSGNFLIKRFSAGGAFIRQWGGSNEIDAANPGLIGQGVQSALGVGPDGRVWTGIVTLYYTEDPPGPWLTQFDPAGTVTNYQTRKPFTFTYDEQVRDVAVEPVTGDLFVADAATNRLRRITSSGTQLAEFLVPEAAGLAFANGKLYAVDPLVNGVRRYAGTFQYELTIGTTGQGNGQLSLDYASGVAVDPAGRVFVADTRNHRIQQFNPDGSFVAKRGGLAPGNTPGQFVYPMDVALSPAGDLLYVADTFNHRVQVFCLGATATCEALLDADADGLRDMQDNCPFVANTDQADTGGVASSNADGIGNACQCGDMNGDNQVTSADVEAVRAELAAPGTLASTARCSVAGGSECDMRDVAVLLRVLTMQKPKLENVCTAAGHSGP